MIRTVRIIVAVLFFATSAAAHHSAAGMHNLDEKVTLKGKVTKVDWKNQLILPDGRERGSARKENVALAPMC